MASSQQHADGCVRLARYGFLLVFYRKSAEPCNLQEEKKEEEEEEKNVLGVYIAALATRDAAEPCC